MTKEYFLATGLSLIIGFIFYGLSVISKYSEYLGILVSFLLLIIGIIFLLIYYF